LLRRKVKKVSDFTEAATHCQALIDGLRELQGAGLAANQIGLDLNILVAEVRKTDLFPDRPESPLLVMLNAQIVERSLETDDLYEGCFSVPGLIGLVPRYTWIEVQYQTIDGEPRLERIDGYLARVVQHEVDHLEGRFYLDRMETMLSLSTRDNYMQYVIASRKQGGNE
jgi:peptide deformylase